MEWKEIITATATIVGVDCNNARYNPINRVPVVVTGNHGCCVYIDIVPTLDVNGNVEDENGGILGVGAGGRGVGGGMAATTGGLAAQSMAVQSLVGQIRWELQELQTNQMADRVAAKKMVCYCQCKHQEDCIATRSEGSRGYNEATIGE